MTLNQSSRLVTVFLGTALVAKSAFFAFEKLILCRAVQHFAAAEAPVKAQNCVGHNVRTRRRPKSDYPLLLA
jgi:hypothetical protein